MFTKRPVRVIVIGLLAMCAGLWVLAFVSDTMWEFLPREAPPRPWWEDLIRWAPFLLNLGIGMFLVDVSVEFLLLRRWARAVFEGVCGSVSCTCS